MGRMLNPKRKKSPSKPKKRMEIIVDDVAPEITTSDTSDKPQALKVYLDDLYAGLKLNDNVADRWIEITNNVQKQESVSNVREQESIQPQIFKGGRISQHSSVEPDGFIVMSDSGLEWHEPEGFLIAGDSGLEWHRESGKWIKAESKDLIGKVESEDPPGRCNDLWEEEDKW